MINFYGLASTRNVSRWRGTLSDKTKGLQKKYELWWRRRKEKGIEGKPEKRAKPLLSSYHGRFFSIIPRYILVHWIFSFNFVVCRFDGELALSFFTRPRESRRITAAKYKLNIYAAAAGAAGFIQWPRQCLVDTTSLPVYDSVQHSVK